jgi:hypothetical protein
MKNDRAKSDRINFCCLKIKRIKTSRLGMWWWLRQRIASELHQFPHRRTDRPGVTPGLTPYICYATGGGGAEPGLTWGLCVL